MIVNFQSQSKEVKIKSVKLNPKNELVVVYSDNRVYNTGEIISKIKENGIIFTPTIKNNVLYWTNNKGALNPPAFDFIKQNSLKWNETGWGDIEDDSSVSLNNEYIWETF